MRASILARLRQVCWLAFAFLVTPDWPALAQYDPDCRLALVMDTVTVEQNSFRAYAMRQVMDESTYSQTSRGLMAWSGSSAINYNDGRQSQSRKFASYQTNFTGEDYLNYASSILSGQGAATFLRCKELQSSRSGLHAWVTGVQGDTIGVSVRWTPSQGDTKPLNVVAQWTGEQGRGQNTTSLKFVVNEVKQLRFSFTAHQNFYLDFVRDTGRKEPGRAIETLASVQIPAPPEITECSIPLDSAKTASSKEDFEFRCDMPGAAKVDVVTFGALRAPHDDVTDIRVWLQVWDASGGVGSQVLREFWADSSHSTSVFGLNRTGYNVVVPPDGVVRGRLYIQQCERSGGRLVPCRLDEGARVLVRRTETVPRPAVATKAR